MVGGFGAPGNGNRTNALGIERLTLRLATLAVLIVVAFAVLFSRLWFLQVLASDRFVKLGKENRVRKVESEPPRGTIFDRNGVPLVENRRSLTVALDRQLLERPVQRFYVLKRLSRLLDVPHKELRRRLHDATVSPYKPVMVARDVTQNQAIFINEHYEDFPGVTIEEVPLRFYPRGTLAAHVLGYVTQISPSDLKSEHFQGARAPYQPGDMVGKSGVEYAYDRWLRGTPEARRVIVNSTGKVVGSRLIQEQQAGAALYLSLDARIQKLTERALRDGLRAARNSHYEAPAGAVVVMDPRNGHVVALATRPTYNPSVLADGITTAEWDELGYKTTNDPDDDALLNRAIQGQRAPGSTFKVVTAGAALSTGIATPERRINCPGAAVYPPDSPWGSVLFRNWTSTPYGYIDFPTSLEISCDTFYYQLGWELEKAFGVSVGGDGSERFQKYARQAGIGHETGVDIPNEADGRLPDQKWCDANTDIGYCPDGWVPGYTINMAIGQGDLVVTPIQMAVTYAAIANGGTVWEPRIGMTIKKPGGDVRQVKAKVSARLPLERSELQVIREGLERVISGGSGTARGAFSGFPLDRFPLAGKTGTAQLGETVLNDAWFVSYGPTTSPRYVIAVYVEKAGHGGESAAPIARQVWEGIFKIDRDTNVRLGSDVSG